MKRFAEAIRRMIQGLVKAVSRFPLTVLCLLGATILVCYMISLHKDPGLLFQKLMFTCLLGAFLGVAAQFASERFKRLGQMRWIVYAVSALITLGYYLILAPAPNISFEVSIRTTVAVFAMFCAFMWLPSYKGAYDFNRIALTHVKAVFTAVLYSAVLSVGCSSIIAAIDILLFKINSDAYGYTMAVIWILFATLYYLSLLPRFNSEDENDLAFAEEAGQYPRMLEILISYIAIPLVAVYTLVLAAYFIKILVTLHWPSGQLGGMVLAYSTAGLLIYILASLLTNKFAAFYLRFFPKVLIPVVIMQLVSVGIRLNAYGVTESRYYVTLFGIASIVSAILLSLKPISKNGIMVLIMAAFAVLSVVPPVDAFTVSRVSQLNRLENMLQTEGILKDGKITAKTDVSQELRQETTSILNYMDSRNYTKSIAWLPKDFNTNDDMKKVFGFEPAYPEYGKNMDFFYASLDNSKAIGIAGYDIMIPGHVYQNMPAKDMPADQFVIQGVSYNLELKRVSNYETQVIIKDGDGKKLLSTGLYDFVKSLKKNSNRPKESMLPAEMSFDVSNHGYKMKILFQNINVSYGNGVDVGANYDFYILFGVPKDVK